MIPFGGSGGFQFKMIDLEEAGVLENDSGHLSGTEIKYKKMIKRKYELASSYQLPW